MSFIYGLCDPVTLKIRYVGQTSKSVESRLGQHIFWANHGGHYYVHNWLRSLESAPRIIILDSDPIDLDEAESFWIEHFRNSGVKLTNYTDGGFSLRGYKITEEHREKLRLRRGWHHTPEAKKKMSASQKGNKNSLGYVPTQEKRRKISEGNKGHKPSQETRMKLSLAGLGRKHSPETRAKISSALISHTVSAETRAKISRTKTGVSRGDIGNQN